MESRRTRPLLAEGERILSRAEEARLDPTHLEDVPGDEASTPAVAAQELVTLASAAMENAPLAVSKSISSRLSCVIPFTVHLTLIALSTFSLLYCSVFALTRGIDAAFAVIRSWALALALTLLILWPLEHLVLVALHLHLVPLLRANMGSSADSTETQHDVLCFVVEGRALPSAGAQAAGLGSEDAFFALAPLHVLRAAWAWGEGAEPQEAPAPQGRRTALVVPSCRVPTQTASSLHAGLRLTLLARVHRLLVDAVDTDATAAVTVDATAAGALDTPEKVLHESQGAIHAVSSRDGDASPLQRSSASASGSSAASDIAAVSQGST